MTTTDTEDPHAGTFKGMKPWMDLHIEAADRIDELERAVDKAVEIVADPQAVHVNMLRGTIAKPSIQQIAHTYPEIAALLVAGDELVAALERYGFPVSDAAEPALMEGGSREAKALHIAAKAFIAGRQALEDGGRHD